MLPAPGDLFYDAQAERDLGKMSNDGGTVVRLYRRGVFIGYGVPRQAPFRVEPSVAV